MFILPKSRTCLCFIAFILVAQINGQYLENNSCTHPSGDPARCIPKLQCEEVTILLSHGVKPVKCHEDNEDLVCCREKTASVPQLLLFPNEKLTTDAASGSRSLEQGLSGPSGSSYRNHIPPSSDSSLPFIDYSTRNHRESRWPIENSVTACSKYKRLTPASFNAQVLLLHPVKDEVRVSACSKRSAPFIINGKNASPGEFPHMALLGYLNNNESLWACGGSLISEYFVLTAAHCTVTAFGSPVVVRLGEHNLFSPDMEVHRDYTIADTIVHKEYNNFQFYNDIALLRLKERVFFNNYIRPACLPPESLTFTSAIATGWGLTDGFGDVNSDTLQKVVLKPKPTSLCRKQYRALANTNRLFMGIDPSSQMCYGEDGGKDSSQGDSGGPLQVVDDSCNYYIVGITSFGKPFGNRTTFGVYTRVRRYSDWIESVVWPADRSTAPIIFFDK